MNVIIGAGISGLTYAAFSNEDYIILESSSEVGGYCKTTKRSGFTWDYAGHFFHFTDENIKNWVMSRVEKQNVHSVEKITKIKLNDRYIDFPFQKNIHQLDKRDYIDCLVGLAESDSIKDIDSFKDMILSKFGKGICERFLIPYNEKLYATELDNLDSDAMGRFFPYADLKEIILNSKVNDNNSYNSRFIYPEGGSIEFVKAISKEVNKDKIYLNKKVINVNVNDKIITTSDGSTYSYNKLINTAPITSFFDMVNIEYDKEIYSSNYVSVLNIGFDKPPLENHHWVYIPSEDISFYRVGYYNNILSQEAMSVYVELGRKKEDEDIPEELLDKVLFDLRKLNMIDDHKVVDWQYIKMDPAYVHINKECEMDKLIKFKQLNKDSIYSIGRYGRWTYCSIEDNIIEAKELAEKHNKNQ